ncbi:MAG: arginine--tRNA ligase [Stappiaceae bacterium]
MNIFADFTQRVRAAVTKLELTTPDGTAMDLQRVAVEPPRDPAHGDLATNAALVLAKSVGMKPRDLAERLSQLLGEDSDIQKIEIAGPGFINLRLSKAFWPKVLQAVLNDGPRYGTGSRGRGEKVNVEYVSVNPTGPLHVGHCRGAVVGDALANLLAYAGWDVSREYYINDAGAQVDVLARSAYLRYQEALGKTVEEIPAGLYPGEYLVPVGAALAEKYGSTLLDQTESDWLPAVKSAAIDAMMDLIRADLELLNIHHDIFFSEKSLHDSTQGSSKIEEMLDAFREAGLVYQGTLPPPKGQVPEDWEDRQQTLFRATDFGDDIDRALKKSDGSYTYFAADVAYFRSKFERGFTQMIYVLGADHGGYVKRLQAVGRAIAGDQANVVVRLCQLVKLYRGGKPVKMSKRAGDFITLRDVVDEVGSDPVRYMMLYRKNDAPLDFDFQKVTEQSKDNPVFYVQYAHARCASIFRQAASEMPDMNVESTALNGASYEKLSDSGEIEIIAKLAEWPRLVDGAAEAQEPHRVAFYLYELASALHSQWNRGKDLSELRFIIQDDATLTQARLALIHAVSVVLASGLRILGVSAPDEMR